MGIIAQHNWLKKNKVYLRHELSGTEEDISFYDAAEQHLSITLLHKKLTLHEWSSFASSHVNVTRILSVCIVPQERGKLRVVQQEQITY